MITRFTNFLTKEKLLIIVLIVATTLRFVGTNPGFNRFHSDEGITYSAAVSMIKNSNLDPLRYDYPSLVPLTNYIFFRTIFIPISWTKYYISNTSLILDGLIHIPIAKLERDKVFQTFVLGDREINALFWGRYVTALISLGNVLATYFLAKKLFNKNVAIIAALLLAINFKAVVNSHIGLPDTYNAFFLLLSLIASYKLIDNPSSKNYILAGIFLGLSFSTKYQIFALFPLLFSHIYIVYIKKEKLISLKIISAGLTSLVVFVLLNPYFFMNIEESIEIVTYVSKKYSMGRKNLLIYPISYFYHIDYGPALFISVVAGIYFTLKKFSKQAIFLLAEVMPFFYILIYYSSGGFYIRNFVTITPILMIFAAVFVNYIFNRLRYFSKSIIVPILLLVCLIFVPTKNSLINVYYNTKPWTYENIKTKYADIFLKNSVVASHPFDPLPDNIKRTDFSRSISYSLAEFREDKADYALINMDWAGNDFYSWMLERFPKSLSYFNKPINKINNIFTAISTEEMMDYVVADSYKPWQASDAALFLVKIPYFRGVDFTNLGDEVKLNNDDNYLNQARVVSDEIEIQPNYVYKITGLIKSRDLIELEKRNVFIRIDFFAKQSLADDKGMQVSVSPRYYGEGWQKIELITHAPKNAKFARVSLQACDGEIGQYIIKDLVIKKSDIEYEVENNYKKIGFDQYKDLLYPYSHGNL